MQPRKLAFIDTLRGLAALYVVLFHISTIDASVIILPDWLSHFIYDGGSGVMLFFIVSAFTLCLSMDARSTGEAEPVWNFYLRRLFRIAPLFYFWMVIYYFRDIWYYHDIHPVSEVAPSFFFVLNLIPSQEQGYVWASWSIGTEMLFYAVFPLIFFYTRNIGIAIALLLLAFAIRVPWHAFVLSAVAPQTEAPLFYDYSLIFNLGVFLFGVVLFHFYKMIDLAKAARFGVGYALIALAAAGLVFHDYDAMSTDRTLDVTVETILFSALLFGLAITPVGFLVNRVTQFYGKISYSVYLSHATTVFFMSPIFAFVYRQTAYESLAFGICVLLALAVITPLSYATYRLVEAPGNAMGHTMIRRRAPKLEARLLHR